MQAEHIPGSFADDLSKPSDDAGLECRICWHVCDPVKGDDYWQIAAGTAFSQFPDHWTYPRSATVKKSTSGCLKVKSHAYLNHQNQHPLQAPDCGAF